MTDSEQNFDTGYLIVQVYTAGMGLPISGAYVTVKLKTGEAYRVLVTDINGKTEKIALSAPPGENSLNPSNTDSYEEYTVQTDKEGYYPVENLNVPILSGETTIQQVALLPLPLGYQIKPQIFVDEEPANL